MTPLRQRLTQDLQLRGYADRTVEAVQAVARLARFYNNVPRRFVSGSQKLMRRAYTRPRFGAHSNPEPMLVTLCLANTYGASTKTRPAGQALAS